MKKTFVGVEKFSNEDLFSRVLASSSVYEMTKKKKKKKELFKSRTTLVQRERERERGKKITQHKAEKWISSKARSFKFLFFFFPSREFAICLLSFTKKNVSDRFTKYQISAIFLSTEKMNFCTAVNEEIKWNYGGGYLWRRKYGE